MNIGLNLLHVRPSIGGGWNWIQSVLETLGELDNINQYWCYCTSACDCLVPHRANFRKVVSGAWARNQYGRILMENTLLQWYAIRDRLDLMHWVGNTRSIVCLVKSVVSISDLNVFEAKESNRRLIHRLYLRVMVAFASHHATVLSPLSRSTEDALVHRFAIDRGRCVVIPHPIGSAFKPASSEALAAIRRAFSLPVRFWLYVAHYYPHKNHSKLFEAYRVYRSQASESWPLVLVGMKNGADALVEERLRQEGIQDHVIWLPQLRQDELVALYSAATALIFPSKYEGGGIPVMEAMACGCPVTASDIPTTREFAGEAALRFDPNETSDIVEKMLLFASDVALRERHRVCGFQQIANMRGEVVFSKIMGAYQQAMQCQT